jgi:predicted nucleic acid-binding protein
MLRYALDTNLCIRALRDRSPTLRQRFNREADGLSISTIVLTELLHGAAKSGRPDANRREVENFAARLEVLPFDAQAAAHAGDIGARAPGSVDRRLRPADRRSRPQSRVRRRHRQSRRVRPRRGIALRGLALGRLNSPALPL